MSALLKTISLSIGYGNNILFRGLDLELLPGKLICFMGPNGIGKSSLIRTLSGIQKPLAGKVELQSASSDNNPTQISVVLTDKISASNMNVRELITFGRYPYLDWRIRLSDEDRKLIDTAIAQLNLEKISRVKIQELSDGQLQMVMIARALAQNTPIILLDEPTAHLDLNNRVQIMKMLREIARKQNKAILVSTHELDLALQTADYIWLSGKDKNILTGFPEDLVLNGSFDDIFQFKGYDLKSGKVDHEVYRKEVISLKGEGYHLLWTKNALERSGYKVEVTTRSDNSDQVIIEIVTEESKPRWLMIKNNRQYEFSTIAGLTEHI